uniref:CHK kinase-like domain-containing protein n=1 Tax=Lutzomyia longipalpis TaxID=7200 RepID=A0A1B0CUL4_LUTLO
MLPDSELMGDFTDKYNAFPKEILLYAKIIPGLEEIWQKAGHPVEFGPKLYFSSESPKVLIVMDDLKAKGYRMIPRQEGLSLEQGKVLLTKLAKFHSASNLEFDLKNIAEELLKKKSQNLLSYDVYPAAGKGNNFSSVIHRIEIKFLDKDSGIVTEKFIIKILPSGDRGKFMEKHNIFYREIHVYDSILPQVSSLLSQIGCTTKLAPECITVLSNPCTLVLEDLCNSNYKMLNRREGLNLEQSMDVLENIAKFHAASVKISEINPKSMEMLFENSISECINSFCIFYKTGLASLKELIEQWEGFEEIAEKLENLQERIIEKIFENYMKKSTFCVLNHNDLWTNNVMFKYDSSGKLINSAIIDYQFVYWGSPAIDLNFFLYTSIEEGVRKAHWNHLIHHYHKILSKTLKDLKATTIVPKVTEIHAEVIQRGVQGILACLLKAAVIIAPVESVDFGLILSEREEGASYRRQLFSNPKYVEFIKPLICEAGE